MRLLLFIALGGAIGAVTRHLVSGGIARLTGFPAFPVGTFTVNILGSALMGVLVGMMTDRINLSLEMRAFLTVGLLGGFTTFSAFSMEAFLLMQRGTYLPAFLYMAGSVIVGIAGLMLGFTAAKALT